MSQLIKAVSVPSGNLKLISQVDVCVVFGAFDPSLAYEAARLATLNPKLMVIFSGGVGKDSGALAVLEIPEAVFLAAVALSVGMRPAQILIEREAHNGESNARLSLELALGRGLLRPGGMAASLAPALRSRRMYEELRFQLRDVSGSTGATGFSSGLEEVDDLSNDTLNEIQREIRGLRRMHASVPPRVFFLPDFHEGGRYYSVLSKLEAQNGS